VNYAYLSEALFSYGVIEAICESCLKESPAEARELYFDFLGFIIKYFLELIRTGSQGSLERKIKVFELKSLIFSVFIEKTIVSIAKNVGTEQLTDVSGCKPSCSKTSWRTSASGRSTTCCGSCGTRRACRSTSRGYSRRTRPQ
jgi:hypothetical protein